MEEKISVQDLYDHIVKHMSAEEALKILLRSSLITYEKLKFDKDEKPVHPLLIISMATLDLGWSFMIADDPQVQGLVVGTEEYIGRIFPKNKKEETL